MLVLNRGYMPVHITSVRRAVTLIYLEIAKGVDQSYQTFGWRDLEELAQMSGCELGDDFHYLKRVNGRLPVPRVIVLGDYDKIPQRTVRFSRAHVFLRDQYQCQYCRKEFPKSKLNLDHVMPRSRGGKTSWENLVTSCHVCNRRKADRTPNEANMPLAKVPRRPSGTLGLLNLTKVHESWQPFLFQT